VSIAELPAAHQRLESPSYPGAGRTPPQDVAAEQGVLGAMMLSKDAIADVVESVRGTDFYRPAHETIYDAGIDLYGRGEPADAVTVAAELQRQGELGRVGGAPYLHTLVASVPVAANAGYYAEIVREKAILRRLVDAGTKIVQIGYAEEGDVDDVVDRAQAEVYAVTEKRTSEDYAPLSEIMESTLDEIEAIGARDGKLAGVPTGFAELDELTNGLHPGQMVTLAARPGVGKALAVTTPLPTPSGWTTMADVRVGDQLLGGDGRPTTVVAATQTMLGRPCYRVTFSDGSAIVADAQHQWLTSTQASGEPAVATTEEIAAALRGRAAADPGVAHVVANTAPLQLPKRDLALAPYALGLWLGSGRAAAAPLPTMTARHLALSRAGHGSASPPVQLAGAGARSRGPGCGAWPQGAGPAFAGHRATATLTAGLRSLGVLHDRHIPAGYLRGSLAQRRALLAGLADGQAAVVAAGGGSATPERRLAADIHELRVSLGLSGDPSTEVRAAAAGCRRITQVSPVASVPVRCVQVDNADQLYLAGRSMVPTHNSTLGLDLARSAAIRHGLASVIFSLEMTRTEITMRLLSAEAKIALHHMRNGHMSDDDWSRLARKMGEISNAPLFIDDSPHLTMMEIRAKARRLRQRHDLRLIVVDYMQLMQSGKRVESRQLEVSEFSRQMKLLAKELDLPVVAISQLNRGPEQRTDKKPLLSDLRESGSIEQDSDMVILLHREDMYERESPRAGEADLIVAKHRNGPTKAVTVAFQGQYSRFVDMAR
jgi:replicative DNA helicase